MRVSTLVYWFHTFSETHIPFHLCSVERQPPEKLADRAFQYYRAYNKVGDIITMVELGTATQEELQHAVKYLKIGGPRAAIGIY
jgi:hypothetical protein